MAPPLATALFLSMMKERIDELPKMGTGAGLTTNNPNRESKIFTKQNTFRTEQGKGHYLEIHRVENRRIVRPGLPLLEL